MCTRRWRFFPLKDFKIIQQSWSNGAFPSLTKQRPTGIYKTDSHLLSGLFRKPHHQIRQQFPSLLFRKKNFIYKAREGREKQQQQQQQKKLKFQRQRVLGVL